METVKALLKNLVVQGVFGDGQLLEIEDDIGEGKGAQLMSEIKFFKLHLVQSSIAKKLNIIVKLQLKDNPRVADCRTDLQFANEFAMYNMILLELGACKLEVAPKMLHGNITEGKDFEEDIIILEDLRSSGYKLADNLFFDYDHVVLTLYKLGEFHGLSYKSKHESPERFKRLCEVLSPRQYKRVEGLFDGALYRGFAPLIENSVVKSAYEKIIDLVYRDDGNTTEEPFTVITHGDFNRNNLLYNYDENDKVLGVKFIDFAFSYYADPVFDISFFLYMHTSHELRQEHWDDFLNSYWEGVTSIGDPGFSFDKFLKNFAKRAIWGYTPCCFWLPMMMFPHLLKVRETLDGTVEEKREFGLTAGGQESTTAVCNIIRHLLDMGYLEEFVKNY